MVNVLLQYTWLYAFWYPLAKIVTLNGKFFSFLLCLYIQKNLAYFHKIKNKKIRYNLFFSNLYSTTKINDMKKDLLTEKINKAEPSCLTATKIIVITTEVGIHPLVKLTLTNYSPKLLIYTAWKHQNNFRFSDHLSWCF